MKTIIIAALLMLSTTTFAYEMCDMDGSNCHDSCEICDMDGTNCQVVC